MMICKADFEELFPHIFKPDIPEDEPEQPRAAMNAAPQEPEPFRADDAAGNDDEDLRPAA
ncbi:hypothetical protein [Marivita sp. GX14005]|uniref:hypothetical protein n=1 Tax=Marivita sp. GX14005 TaxID=2942276 RepID=UPI0020198DCB|nr:hypothetical protein [Marivita sp. GX14005]MCL3883178.1 hypothetical protein [Marivita sp. GX14005]